MFLHPNTMRKEIFCTFLLASIAIYPALCEEEEEPVQLQPLHTSERWILDSNNQRFKFRCINWAGHMEAGIPEGLSHASVGSLVDIISSSGFNCVRLTFSIDMALSQTTPVSESFASLAARTGADEGAVDQLWQNIVQKNGWIEKATLGDTFGKVVDVLGEKGIRVVLDNHVSHASWCCNLEDGNGWWNTAKGGNISSNSRYFDPDEWAQGLAAIASFSTVHPAVVGIGLRNEIRPIPILQDSIGHEDWYEYITEGAKAVHDANPDLLIIMGGVMSSTDFSFLRTKPFDRSPFGDKIVWEWHTYTFSPAWITSFENCELWKDYLGGLTGFLLEQDEPFTGPLWLSEFGFGMTGGPPEQSGLSDKDFKYITCLVEYMESNDGDWALWALQGSYYVRDGNVDADESWGLLNSDWSDWRNPAVKELLGNMWSQTQGP